MSAKKCFLRQSHLHVQSCSLCKLSPSHLKRNTLLVESRVVSQICVIYPVQRVLPYNVEIAAVKHLIDSVSERAGHQSSLPSLQINGLVTRMILNFHIAEHHYCFKKRAVATRAVVTPNIFILRSFVGNKTFYKKVFVCGLTSPTLCMLK